MDFTRQYEQLVKSLTCSICHEILTDPRDLSCGHTYCLACIKAYAGIKGWTKTIECPQCRKETAIPAAGLTELKQNYKLRCIIEEQSDSLRKVTQSKEDAAIASEAKVEMFVQDLDGKKRPINIQLSAGVGALKRVVHEVTGFHTNSQRLIFQGKVLDENNEQGPQTLSGLGLSERCKIELVVTQKGGISL